MITHNNKTRRKAFLTIHLLASGFIGTFIYGDHFQTLVQFVFFPIVGLSGLLMWKLPWLLKRKNYDHDSKWEKNREYSKKNADKNESISP